MNFTNAIVVARTDWTKLNTAIKETKDETVLPQEIELTKVNSFPTGESSEKTQDTSMVKQVSQ